MKTPYKLRKCKFCFYWRIEYIDTEFGKCLISLNTISKIGDRTACKEFELKPEYQPKEEDLVCGNCKYYEPDEEPKSLLGTCKNEPQYQDRFNDDIACRYFEIKADKIKTDEEEK